MLSRCFAIRYFFNILIVAVYFSQQELTQNLKKWEHLKARGGKFLLSI